ncbi:MAG: type II secretion system protein [Parcubacteria group bacterium]|nr:type II secretion system protein [Parcubacteria group bacterium]
MRDSTWHRGVTIVEILVVVAIISIMAGVLLTVSNRTQRERALLERVSGQFVSDIREAQNFASSGRKAKDPTDGKLKFPPGGYGVEFNQGANTYTIFADFNSDRVYYPSSGPKDEKIHVRTLPDAFRLHWVACSWNEDPNKKCTSLQYVLFAPPNPSILIGDRNKVPGSGDNRQGADALDIDIRIPSVGGCGNTQDCKRVRITREGLMTIQNL